MSRVGPLLKVDQRTNVERVLTNHKYEFAKFRLIGADQVVFILLIFSDP